MHPGRSLARCWDSHVQKEEEGERRKEGDGNEEAKVEVEREREGGRGVEGIKGRLWYDMETQRGY